MSDAGKYRWMRDEEAQEEIPEGTFVWVFQLGRMDCGAYSGPSTLEQGDYGITEIRTDARICRAMVPEAPHQPEKEHGE